jgi:hypothetical protein
MFVIPEVLNLADGLIAGDQGVNNSATSWGGSAAKMSVRPSQAFGPPRPPRLSEIGGRPSFLKHDALVQ